MYPDFYNLFKDIFGIEIPFFSLLKTFGFLVAMAFLAAGYVLFLELKRKESAGKIGFLIKEIKPASNRIWTDYISNAAIGFFIGYKVIDMFMHIKEASPDPMGYLFSHPGNIMLGWCGMAIGIALKYFTTPKIKSVDQEIRKVKFYPSARVGDIAIIAALCGFAGAKIFNAFETWDQFIQDPLGSLLSSSGLTFYGGLIVATFALWLFARKLKFDFRHLCDAAAPALILGYAIGRLGCQVSGDGDWGIYNAAYMTNEQGKVALSSIPFNEMVQLHADHVYRHFSPTEKIPHASCKGPDFLPNWLFAYNYPKNVNHVGEALPGCNGEYCSVLPLPVFPTPIYEFIMGIIIFLFLWNIRKKFETPLSLFSIYLIANGIERFLIEQIRVNYEYDWGFLHPTQAEIIAVAIFVTGILLFVSRKWIDKIITTHT